MKKAWFSRERITRTNIRVSYMHYARFAYTPDPSRRYSNPNPNRPVAIDELMAADIVPELMYI